ncbi:conjugal transfer protein (plasmid) [Xanthomonas translucens pv. undulosa]|uniref:IncP plasmid survival protein KfrC family protein n=1 Tax=Xanthomonas campestris pv. translucens TaxID=343 RepID=UPI0019D6FF38|nr:IncP plasmid survival protein KfrC family protein [Xanthomonas translucens]QSQ54842.1 conjugal transfer protein [Xanthomonas translucens pv. undulosa]
MKRLTPTAGRADARRIQQPASAGFATSTTSRTDVAGDGLLAAAEATEAEQQAALEAAPLDQTYQEALALYVQAKHDQVERIEDRLENLIDRQQARLQQTQANQPGLLTRPGAKRAWQNQQIQQQARLQSLHVRLEAVREIKEGMGLHSPKVEELATRKMRAENPELASDWDAMREAARRHQALLRRQEQEKKQAQTLERPGRSQSLGLTRAV